MPAPTQAWVRKIPRSYVDYYARRGISVDVDRADAQHAAYIRVLQAAGLAVSVIEADELLPDCVFIEDTAVVWDQQFLVTRMWREREGEQAAVAATLQHTHTKFSLPPDATLDGGDVLHVAGTTYVGLSNRTNSAGVEAVAAFLKPFGRRVVPVPVPRCLHLKTGVTYLGDGTLLAVPDWFDMRVFDVPDVISTEPGEQGAANCLRIRDHLLIPQRYPQTGRKLQRFADEHNLHLTRIEITEFEKGDGGLTCLSIIQ